MTMETMRYMERGVNTKRPAIAGRFDSVRMRLVGDDGLGLNGIATVDGDELVNFVARFVVGVLLRWALHEVGGRSVKRAANAVIECNFAAAKRVDDHAGRVRGVPNLELQLHVQ